MLRAAVLFAVIVVWAAPAAAQDVKGIEICTHEKQMDRRTSCLQSNVEFLQQKINRNDNDAREKVAAAVKEIAALKEALARVQGRLDQLQKAKAETTKPAAK